MRGNHERSRRALLRGLGAAGIGVAGAPAGVAGVSLRVSVADGDVARIGAVDPADGSGLARSTVADDGGAADLRIVDVGGAVEPGATDVELATVAVDALDTGRTPLSVDVETLGTENGATVEATTEAGTVTVGPPRVPDGEGPPTDPDDDGVYEDVNGNGRADYDDVVTLFEGFESDAVRESASAYDVNDDGKLDFDDLVDLYDEVGGS